MAFNFPNSPAEGELFTDATSGAQYVYRNGVWMQSSAAQIKLPAQDENMLVNGAFLISQENGRAGGTTNAYYFADQWQLAFGGTGFGPQAASSLNVAGKTAGYINASVAKASLAAGEYLTMQQPVEGWRLQGLAWGTTNAKPAVLNFKARATNAGTYSLSLRNNANDATFVYDFALPAAGTGYNEFTVPIPVPSIGTWDFQGDTGRIYMMFAHSAGSTYKAPALGWNAGQFFAGPGITNNAAAIGSLVITEVGLYADPQATGVAPTYQYRSLQEEYELCLRYFYDTRNSPLGAVVGGHALGLGQAYSATLCDIFINFPVPMRAAPSGSPSGQWNCTTAGGGAVLGTLGSVIVYNNRIAAMRLNLAGGSGLVGGSTTFCSTNDSAARCLINARM